MLNTCLEKFEIENNFFKVQIKQLKVIPIRFLKTFNEIFMKLKDSKRRTKGVIIHKINKCTETNTNNKISHTAINCYNYSCQ